MDAGRRLASVADGPHHERGAAGDVAGGRGAVTDGDKDAAGDGPADDSKRGVSFGREGQQEVYEASAWLSAGSANAPRALLVEGALLAECFATAQRRWVARASRQSWYLVTGVASPTCVARGATGRLAR